MAKLRHSLLKYLHFGLSAVVFFLSLWVVLPAPTLALLPLSVGAPEVSPWLIGANATLVLLTLKGRQARLAQVALSLSTLGLLLSLVPIAQFSAIAQRTDVAMTQAFGAHYPDTIPQSLRRQMRTRPFEWVDALRGISTPTTVRYTPGIRFAQPEGVPLSLDIYRPPQIGHYPALVVIHGGAWRSGSPAQNADFNRYMASQGYVVWAIAYRLAPRYHFPAQLEDVQTAFSFIAHHAAEYETDLQRLAVMGRSAGAQLAMLTAFSPNTPVKALVNYYGPIDLVAGYKDVPFPDPIDSRSVLRSFLGGSLQEQPERYEQASPIRYVNTPITHSLPPSLLVYGGKDHVVQQKYGRAFERQLQSVGAQAVMVEIPWADHSFDAVFNGVSNQLALYHTERFLAWALRAKTGTS